MNQSELCTPVGPASADVGGSVFNLWMEEEEEQWHLGKKLLSSCPAEFLCPISLDVMTAPVILAETGMTYDRAAIRKWFLLGGDTCPLTGLRLTTTKVLAHQQLQARIERWVAGRSLNVAEEGPSCDALSARLCQGITGSSTLVEDPAGAPNTPVAGTATATAASAIDPSATSEQARAAYIQRELSPADKRRARLEDKLSLGAVLLRALSSGTLALVAPSDSSRARSPALTPLPTPRSAKASTRPESRGGALGQPGLAMSGASLGKGEEGPAGLSQHCAGLEEMPRASPGSIISLVNPIFQQKALSSRAAQRARMAQPVTPDRTGVRSGATGSDACRGAAEACPGECRLWQVQSSAVQAAIDQQRALAAALDSPEASPQQDAGHAPAPRSNSAQEHADPGSRPNQSGHAAAGTARSTTPSAIKAVPKSKAKRGADKRESAKQGAVRNWWEPPPAEEGRAERAGGGGALHTRCTAAHSAHECAAGRPQAADRAQDQTSSPLSSECASAREGVELEGAGRTSSAGSAARLLSPGAADDMGHMADKQAQACSPRHHHDDAGHPAAAPAPALPAALLQWLAGLRRAGVLPQDLAALRPLDKAAGGGALFVARCFGCSGRPGGGARRMCTSGPGKRLAGAAGPEEDGSEDEVVDMHQPRSARCG